MIVSFIHRAVMQGIPLLFGATGEIITEKSGNLNLGIPGVMYVGGISGVIGAFMYENSLPDKSMANPFLAIMIPLLCSLIGSLIMGLIYSFLTTTLRANQNVTGLAITTFGVGLGNFFGGSLIKIVGADVPSITLSTTSKFFSAHLPFADNLGWFGEIFLSYGFLAYLAVIIAIVTSLFLKKTRTGLNLRAVGENPATADAAGVNVTRYKYFCHLHRQYDRGSGRTVLRHGLCQRRLVERRLRRPRMAGDRAGYLHRLEAELRHHRLHPVRRTVHRPQLPQPVLPVHPRGYEHPGADQDGALRRYRSGADLQLHAQQA